MSKFYLKSIIVEEADAWAECEDCGGDREIQSRFDGDDGLDVLIIDCPICNGEGGKWHEAIQIIDFYYAKNVPVLISTPVTKSSVLVREWTCSFYDSPGHAVGLDGIHTPCSKCTAGEWRVKDDND